MSLTLITGPANAAKAGAVLERLSAAIRHDPLLVVPTAADVEHYQRELAASGVVFGVEVLTFSRLVGEIAGRAGLEARPLGRVARERVVRAAIAGVPLRELARSAATPGFAAAAGALFAELQRSLVTPARFTSALRAWAAGNGRATYASELGALYSAYRRRLERLGRPDQEGYAWAALDALRAAPGSWGGRPVFLYGFDDLTPIQRDAVETLVSHAGVDVLVALPYEPGRVAFAGRAATVEELRPLADVVALRERSEYYAASARPALHHLERSLFEPGRDRLPPNGAVRLLEAGGERAEAELVGAAVLELMRQGIEPPDIAVLLRGDSGTTALFAQILSGYGIPVSHEPPRAVRPHAGSAPASWRARAPRSPAARRRTCSPGCARPAGSPIPRRPTRSRCACAAASCAARAPPAPCGSRASAARRSWRSTCSPRRPPRAPSSCCARWRPRPTRSGPRRTAAAPRCWRPRSWPTRASPPTCGRPSPSWPPGGRRRGARGRPARDPRGARRRRGPRAHVDRGFRIAGPRRPTRRRPARGPARDPRAPLPGGLRLRAPGRGVPAPARPGAVPLGRGPARR